MLGKRFIKSVVETTQAVQLAAAELRLFIEPERPLAEFVIGHHAQYHTLPDLQTLQHAGHDLSAINAPEPPDFYLRGMKERYVFNAVNGRMQSFTDAMGADGGDRNMEEVVAVLQEMLTDAGNSGLGHSATSIEDEAQRVLEDYQFAKMNPGLRGVTMGYQTLDEASLGAQGGDIIVIVARPGVGKTYLLLEMMKGAWQVGHRCLFTSMEMPKMQITRRFLGLVSGLNPNFIRAGTLSSAIGEPALQEAVEMMQTAAGRVYLEAGDFEGNVRGVEEMIQQYHPEVVYVDAAYLLTPEGQKQGYISRWESISLVVKQLKRLAVRYNIPIFISVQFNRNQKDAGNKSPDTSDVGGSDAIGQDTSIILAMQRAPAPYEKIRRKITGLKWREGDTVEMLINYRFDPVNLTEIPPLHLMTEEEATEHNPAWTL